MEGGSNGGKSNGNGSEDAESSRVGNNNYAKSKQHSAVPLGGSGKSKESTSRIIHDEEAAYSKNHAQDAQEAKLVIGAKDGSNNGNSGADATTTVPDTTANSEMIMDPAHLLISFKNTTTAAATANTTSAASVVEEGSKDVVAVSESPEDKDKDKSTTCPRETNAPNPPSTETPQNSNDPPKNNKEHPKPQRRPRGLRRVLERRGGCEPIDVGGC